MIKRHILDKYPDIKDKKHIDFYVEFMMTGNAYKSYQKIYSPEMSMGVAATLAGRLLKKVELNFTEFLDIAGHTDDKIAEALDELFEKDVDKYLKHITKLKQLEIQKVEHSGSIELPTVNVITEKK